MLLLNYNFVKSDFEYKSIWKWEIDSIEETKENGKIEQNEAEQNF